MAGVPEGRAGDGLRAEGVLEAFAATDEGGAAALRQRSSDPWQSGFLTARLVEFVAAAVNLAVTGLEAAAAGARPSPPGLQGRTC